MMTSSFPLYPLLLDPVYKDYVWGGDRIARRFNRPVPGGKAAESWEVADRPEGMSIVRNGSLIGRNLGELARTRGAALVGRGADFRVFPLLVKIIDAAQCLSVQVHPDESSAARMNADPKTEAWVVLDAEPGAVVYAGFKRPSGEAEFREALLASRLESLLRAVNVSRGDVIFVPGGRIHCIGGGCLLLEVQQNSDTTYRVYDWQRACRGGKPRELHLEKAVRVIRWDDTGPTASEAVQRRALSAETCEGDGFAELLRCPFFRIERARISKGFSCYMDGRSFHVLFVETGRALIGSEIMSVEAGAGTSVLIPADTREYKIDGANTELIRISLT